MGSTENNKISLTHECVYYSKRHTHRTTTSETLQGPRSRFPPEFGVFLNYTRVLRFDDKLTRTCGSCSVTSSFVRADAGGVGVWWRGEGRRREQRKGLLKGVGPSAVKAVGYCCCA